MRAAPALGFAFAAAGCGHAPLVANDVGRLYPTPVGEVVRVRDAADVRAAIQRAKASNRKVSIAGKKHSQGGQTSYENAVVLDMSGFDKILRLDKDRKIITVQSGATWGEVQDFANRDGLAVEVQQSSNIFTIGGSLSVDAHGRDPNFGPIVQTVRAFRIMLADGSVVEASRAKNAELFSLAIGGFGLFGVILDVDLSLTRNEVYDRRVVEMDYADYSEFFRMKILGHPEVGLHFAWPSIASDGYLKSLLVVTYAKTDQRPWDVFELESEHFVPVTSFFLALSRASEWGKDLRWWLQRKLVARPGSSRIVCRNNAMRPAVLFLKHDSPTDTDILQEYFVPVGRLKSYMDDLRKVLRSFDVNLLSATIRYVPKNTEAFLSYARQDSFAVVLYLNQKLSAEGRERARDWTRKLVDAALAEGGTYYLPYQLYPTREQLLRAYPKFDRFLAKKKQYDPDGLFMNRFYAHYR
jgi:FAD/FMN-containing dehydrogenase